MAKSRWNWDTNPSINLSASEGRYRVIQQGMPISRDMTSPQEALGVASHFRLTVADRAWDGDRGEWVPLSTVVRRSR